jgi:hypothetical protein
MLFLGIVVLYKQKKDLSEAKESLDKSIEILNNFGAKKWI